MKRFTLVSFLLSYSKAWSGMLSSRSSWGRKVSIVSSTPSPIGTEGIEDDEFGETVFPAQLVDGAEVNEGFPGAGLHLDAVVRIDADGCLAVGDAVFLGNGFDVGDDFLAGKVEAVGKAVTLKLEAEEVPLLSVEKADEGCDGLALVGEIFERNSTVEVESESPSSKMMPTRRSGTSLPPNI